MLTLLICPSEYKSMHLLLRPPSPCLHRISLPKENGSHQWPYLGVAPSLAEYISGGLIPWEDEVIRLYPCCNSFPYAVERQHRVPLVQFCILDRCAAIHY